MNNCKHLVWVIWLTLLALPFNSALAQNEEASQNFLINPDHDRIIKLHPLQLGEVYISYEKMREDNISNEFGLSYVYKSYLKSDDFIPEDVKVGGMHVRMSQRHYTSKKQSGVPFGFFHGPMFGYRFLVFDKNLFTQGSDEPGSPSYSYVGRMYQNAIEVNYQL
ncbi:MAG: ABC transporter ATP-binding protein, partial [Pontibacter sp.]|nr:ABC transporter ATP-binding protein [Pontibacter sp.]